MRPAIMCCYATRGSRTFRLCWSERVIEAKTFVRPAVSSGWATGRSDLAMRGTITMAPPRRRPGSSWETLPTDRLASLLRPFHPGQAFAGVVVRKAECGSRQRFQVFDAAPCVMRTRVGGHKQSALPSDGSVSTLRSPSPANPKAVAGSRRVAPYISLHGRHSSPRTAHSP